MIQLERTDAGAFADSRSRRAGGSDIRVGAVIDIQHVRLSTFKQNVLVLIQSVVDCGDCVDDARKQAFADFLELFNKRVVIKRFFLIQLDDLFVLDRKGRGQLGFEVIEIMPSAVK